MRHLRWVVALVVLLALVGASEASGARNLAPWASLRRPLRLVPIAAGAHCPASPRHALDAGRVSGVGPGPVYPMPSGFSAYDRRPGWIASKALWAWPSRLKSHPIRVLVRGFRLDRPGVMRFQLGPDWGSAPLTAELRLTTSDTVGSFGGSSWGATVTLLLVRERGCYAVQLDTAGGSTTVIVDATKG